MGDRRTAHAVGRDRENGPLPAGSWLGYDGENSRTKVQNVVTHSRDKFFGGNDGRTTGGGDRFRRIHLTQGLLFLPYGVAVDHFQYLVYQRSEATAAERHGMWQEMERMYLPWRDYGDLPHVAAGGFWQFQRHIYLHPFYYIDYTLAQTCALQLWVRSQRDPVQTMKDYNALCRRGGEAPFQALAKGAGLISPFEPGCLRDVVAQARASLS